MAGFLKEDLVKNDTEMIVAKCFLEELTSFHKIELGGLTFERCSKVFC